MMNSNRVWLAVLLVVVLGAAGAGADDSVLDFCQPTGNSALDGAHGDPGQGLENGAGQA